ncbi:MAG: phosphoribosylaminoimidazole carboxylase, ATPase subunit [Armatimonadetes bacterium]|nr:phosphoribosylaminoimidazole carboxylase, ATPase subunit [Armatimonadota bacterium]
MTVGILGGGQLGRMLALSGYPLGLRFRVLDTSPEAPAGHLAELIVAPGFDDPAALDELAAGVDVVTYEFENVPVDAARRLVARVPVFPPPAALEAAQERLTEKRFFGSLAIPTPPFAAVTSRDELEEAVSRLGLPAVLKTCRMGYDGKGQFVLREAADVERAWDELSAGAPLILEGFVQFDREVSSLSARGRDGEVVFYPLVQNHHPGGILGLTLAPAPNLTPELQAQAETYARAILEKLEYVGVLALELFQCGDRLLANEMAPRVHNSGHWTTEGAETSQFENHIRAVAGLPLGETTMVGYAAMVNLLGTTPDPAEVLRVPGAHLHLYGKSPAPGRKLGHITVRRDTPEALAASLARIGELVELPITP